MILADKIINERKKLGWSQEELADKLDVSRQSVSKWESAQSTPDLNRILKMAELFGVSTDYLLKDEIEDSTAGGIVEEKNSGKGTLRNVSMEEATEFLRVTREVAPRIALGVSLCILSPTVLLTLLGFSTWGRVTEKTAVAVGVPMILILVAIAVFIFIMCARKTDPFDYLEEEMVETAYGVDGMVKERKKKEEKRNTIYIASGVILCIISAVPLLFSMIFENSKCDTNDGYALFMVVILLAFVSAGVFLICMGAEPISAYNKLLQEGDYTEEGKRYNKVVSVVSGIYWPIVVAAFFIWSYNSNWGVTWIIWPIAGVLFGAACGVIRICMSK